MKDSFARLIRYFAGIILVLSLVLPVSAKLSAAATSFVRQLSESFEERDFREMENWVFEKDLEVDEVIDRVEEAFEVIHLLSDQSQHRQKDERLLERLLQEFPSSTEAWIAASDLQGDLSNYGTSVNGKIVRTEGWQTGIYRFSMYDQIRSIQCLLKARELGEEEGVDGDRRAWIEYRLQQRISNLPTYGEATLTDFETLPEPQRSRVKGSRRRLGIDENGELKVPKLREAFEEATTDDERRYFLLTRAVSLAENTKAVWKEDLARFWYELYGVHRLQNERYLYLRGNESEYDMEAAGEFELHTLKAGETFAVGPEGPKRVTLPEQCQYVAMLRELALDPEVPMETRWSAAGSLIYSIYQDRRQFDQAYDLAKTMGSNTFINSKGEKYVSSFDVSNLEPRATMEGGGAVAYGTSPNVVIYSQGLSEVEVELWRVDLLRERKNPIPFSLGPNPLLGGGAEIYGGEKKQAKVFRKWLEETCDRSRKWTIPVRMKPNRMQTKTQVKIDEERPGSYLLVRKSGKEWEALSFQIYDVAVVHGGVVEREEQEEPVCYAIDPQSGEALEGVEIRSVVGKFDSQFYTVSDHRGQLIGVPESGLGIVKRPGSDWQLVRWQTRGWNEELWTEEEILSFLTTNQPLYRPGQRVLLAGWLRRAPEWMGWEPALPEQMSARILVLDPTGREVWKGYRKLDKFGGFTGEFQLGDEIVLGEYRIQIRAGILDVKHESENEEVAWDEVDFEITTGSWSFEVGEFRKPDFEVSLELEPNGDELEAVIEARYLSGDPVKGAAVQVSLIGRPFLERFHPKRIWDELFEPGYEWGQSIPRHVPGWREWAMWSSSTEWLDPDFYEDQPLGQFVNLNSEGVTGGDGKLRVKFENGFPLLSRYGYGTEVSATVTEFSGRAVTEVENLVYTGRKFEVFARPLKGFYRTGEEILFEVGCLDIRGEASEGNGLLKFERMVSGDYETVFERKVEVGPSGVEVVKFPAPEGGQYRCVFEGGGSQRGVIVEVVSEESSVGKYNGVQIIPRDILTNAGEVLEVLVKTDAPTTTVWIFEKQPNGLGRSPRQVTTKNHTAVFKLPVIKAARPSFTLEALVFWKGRTFVDRCSILVPDQKSRLDVAISVDQEVFEPGGLAGLEVNVRDFGGRPAEASIALTVFDRALENLTGGLPKTEQLRSAIFFEDSVTTSMGEGEYQGYGGLDEEGVFSGRGAFFSEVLHKEQSQFVQVGEATWRSYEPPELPNQGGGGLGVASSGGGMIGSGSGGAQSYVPGEAKFYALSRSQSDRLDEIEMRKNFADRAYWGGALRTAEDGRVRVEFELPENLTSWRVQSWAFGRGRSFGDAELELPVSKKLQVRPLIPRAAIVGDELVIGAMIQNLSQSSGDFVLKLEAQGVEVLDQGARMIQLEAGAEGMAQWRVAIGKSGAASFRVKATGDDGKLDDGFEHRVPVAPREVRKMISNGAVMRKGEKISELRIPYDPAMRGKEIEIRVEAHPAVSALGVLPDLVQYPYGCAEQTLNRFLPLLVASASAKQLGLDWEQVTQVFQGRKDPLGWISGRAQTGQTRKALDLTEDRVDDMVHVGRDRLGKLQNRDGSWGWFSRDDPNSRVYLTALAVRGLVMAGEIMQESKKSSALDDGVDWLENWSEQKFSEESDVRLLIKAAFVAWVLQEAKCEAVEDLIEQLWVVRDLVPLTSQIHLALALRDNAKEAILMRSIREKMTKEDFKQGGYFSWWNEPVERRACYLKLLVRENVAEKDLNREIRLLLASRRDGIRWKSTRESGICLEAIVEAMVSMGLDPFREGSVAEIEIVVGEKTDKIGLSEPKMWTDGVTFPVNELEVREGQIVFQVTRRGDLDSMVCLNGTVIFPSSNPEEMAKAEAGLNLDRQYFRLGPNGERVLMKVGEVLKVGEMIEVELLIGTNEPREFLHLRDPIPAGLEPLMQLSGYHQGAYRESRTGESHFFISELSEWNRTQRYRLSVVTEGTCLALPAQVECMYSPEIRGRAEARELTIER